MYVYVCVCMCMYVNVCICMSMYVYVCISMCTYLYVCMYECLYMYVYVCMYMYVYVCICMYMYMYVYVCAHICSKRPSYIKVLIHSGSPGAKLAHLCPVLCSSPVNFVTSSSNASRQFAVGLGVGKPSPGC